MCKIPQVEQKKTTVCHKCPDLFFVHKCNYMFHCSSNDDGGDDGSTQHPYFSGLLAEACDPLYKELDAAALQMPSYDCLSDNKIEFCYGCCLCGSYRLLGGSGLDIIATFKIILANTHDIPFSFFYTKISNCQKTFKYQK